MENIKTRDRKKFQKNYIVAFISIIVVLLCFIITISTAINLNRPSTAFTQITHEKSGEVLFLEIASTPQARARGYMFRENIKKDEGMLFIFEDEEYREFWMKDTPTSLDIIFLDKEFKVINFYKETQPNQTNETYPSGKPAKYVLETRSGFVDRANVSNGDSFSIQ